MIRVTMRDVGGAFGQKIPRGREEMVAVLASRRLGVPVKWIEDRQENLMAANHARDEQMTVSLGVDERGCIQAARAEYLGDVGAYPFFPPFVIGHMALTLLPGPYRLAHYGWSGEAVYTNTSGAGAYRGPWMMETVSREIVVDVLARELGMDPAELRRRNLISAADLPYTTITGSEYDRITPLETFEATLEAVGYDAFRKRQRELRAEGRYLGVGICTYVEPTAGGQGSSFGVEAATIRIQPSGKVDVLMGTGSHGHSLETTMVQVVADQLGVPIEDVRLHQGDTEVSPYGGGTAGSRSAVIAGGAARISSARLRTKVLEIAAHMLEAAADDLEIERAVISVKGSPDASLSLAEVARTAYRGPDHLPEGMEAGLEDTSRYAPAAPTFANSTQICTCEVDTETGLVTLLDWVVGGDYGVMINPMVVEGQIAGGVVQGIGGALLEHMPYNQDGTPLAITFKDYLLPTAANVPDIRYVHLETPSDRPGGHKGVGEGGAIGAPAAVVNAVSDALSPLGIIVTDQPLSPDRLLALIDASRGECRQS
jgi:carbon-monoxide dehydrogenase large subunit